MNISTGLFEHMVLQRGAGNLSDSPVTGSCQTAGEVWVTVTGAAGQPPVWAEPRHVGQAAKGKFTVRLAGVPAGGPYTVTLEIRPAQGRPSERLTVRDLLVGDVWLLAGQSNMQGCGLLQQPLPAAPQVRAFYMTDRWAVAAEPVHNLWAAVDPVHVAINGGVPHAKPAADWGTGPAVSFGQEMWRRRGVPQGLIACAHGGTSMEQWDPARRDEGGDSLYGALVRRLRKNGGRVAGLLWYQGCSDTNPPRLVALYTARMKTLIAAVRRDCHAPTLPVVLAQIGRVVGQDWTLATGWNAIQEQQRQLQQQVRHCAVVPVIDQALDDAIHIGEAEQHRLGQRFAQAMEALAGAPDAGPLPIAYAGCRLRRWRTTAVLEVRFKNVAGALRAGGRPSGFSVTMPGLNSNLVFDTRIHGDRVELRLTQAPLASAGACLQYGQGTDPYCNITDELDRSLPVFGPVATGKPRAMSPPLTRWRVSPLLPSAGRLEGLACPGPKVATEARAFQNEYCSRHEELATAGASDPLIVFAGAYECAEAMAPVLIFGYDGPVKVWVDGRELYADPKGSNPIMPAEDTLAIPGGVGRHELVIAMGANHGQAWGIFAQFERTDLPPNLLSQPGQFSRLLPTWLG
jgi:sialate O-acetylesterase